MRKYENFAAAPLNVRQRYFRIRYAKYFMALSRLYSRITLTFKERKKQKILASTIDEYHKLAVQQKVKGNECTQTLVNMALYFLIAEADIQAVKIDALAHHDPWKRKLSQRIILLTIYEWNMSKASNKNLKSLLTQANVSEELQSKLFAALRILRKAQEKAAKILHVERNAIIAHRDPDALLQISTINSLRSNLVFDVAAEFYEAADGFIRIFPVVLQQAGSIQGLFSYMLNKPNK